MSQTMKLGLALSGGGAIGAYEAGVVKALAESGTDVHMVSGAYWRVERRDYRLFFRAVAGGGTDGGNLGPSG
jgi:hypothetical protein